MKCFACCHYGHKFQTLIVLEQKMKQFTNPCNSKMGPKFLDSGLHTFLQLLKIQPVDNDKTKLIILPETLYEIV